MNVNETSAKRAARTLRDELGRSELNITHGLALELVAHQLGYPDWNTASAVLRSAPAVPLGAVPVLRIQDEKAAREFYLDYLGFTELWDHRYEPGMPLYLRIARDDIVLDLSEHYGDGTPGSVVWIPVTDVYSYNAELLAKHNTRSRPGIEEDAPGGPTMSVIDPSSNVLRFCQPGGRGAHRPQTQHREAR